MVEATLTDLASPSVFRGYLTQKKTGGAAGGGGSRDRTRHYPLAKNPHKMEEVQKK